MHTIVVQLSMWRCSDELRIRTEELHQNSKNYLEHDGPITGAMEAWADKGGFCFLLLLQLSSLLLNRIRAIIELLIENHLVSVPIGVPLRDRSLRNGVGALTRTRVPETSGNADKEYLGIVIGRDGGELGSRRKSARFWSLSLVCLFSADCAIVLSFPITTFAEIIQKKYHIGTKTSAYLVGLMSSMLSFLYEIFDEESTAVILIDSIAVAVVTCFIFILMIYGRDCFV
ncbi:uncharacterized protein A4U43_C02F5450 [Asparagus officinalis]|uniref:Uncharacterized protein n=1 Tax=Asparagus officinalis TaxID=4686 RepID=A0A5P1FHY7_ASPOF|nr:uncharacterized protein A4U43_C02F5450 [Asparagus officinalis]